MLCAYQTAFSGALALLDSFCCCSLLRQPPPPPCSEFFARESFRDEGVRSCCPQLPTRLLCCKNNWATRVTVTGRTKRKKGGGACCVQWRQASHAGQKPLVGRSMSLERFTLSRIRCCRKALAASAGTQPVQVCERCREHTGLRQDRRRGK